MSSPSHTNTTLPHLKYRADIDGLRAIAVLAIVGFHAFPKSFRGGYIGVDVFFVISGFLISSIIFQGLERGNFSFKEFYTRRIRRIFPSLFVVLTACYALGWWVLFADEFMQLCQHIGAGAGFIANLVLWSEAGYFDNAAETKPLLHLWSLGIEEQFYIVWPFLLYIAWRRRFNLFVVILSILVVSFVYNVSTVGSDAVAAFYSPISRFWELLIGSALAYLTLHKQDILGWTTERFGSSVRAIIVDNESHSDSLNIREAKSVVGLVLILATTFGLNKSITFPGWWPLLPTLGTYLLISAGPYAWLNKNILSRGPLVGIGLISYPLYLWHWPLLSFARIVESRTPSQPIRVAAVIISLLLAWLTYRMVENPIRRSRKNFALVLLALIGAMGSVGLMTFSNDGFPSEQRPMRPITDRGRASDSSCAQYFGNQPFFNYCKANSNRRPTIAVIGDSHAQAIYDGIVKQYGADHNVILTAHTGCPPLIGTDVYPTRKTGDKKECHRIYQQILKFLADESVGIVFLIGRGPFYLNGGPGPKYSIERAGVKSADEAYHLGLRDMIIQLRGKQIYLLIENPRFDHTPLECVRRFRLSSNCEGNIMRSTHSSEQAPYLKIIEQISREFPDVILLDPTDYFCDTNICSQTISGRNLYADTHHLSQIGGEKLIEYFVSRNRLTRTGLLHPPPQLTSRH